MPALKNLFELRDKLNAVHLQNWVTHFVAENVNDEEKIVVVSTKTGSCRFVVAAAPGATYCLQTGVSLLQTYFVTLIVC